MRSTVERLLQRFSASGLTWPPDPAMTDAELERRLYQGPAHQGAAKSFDVQLLDDDTALVVDSAGNDLLRVTNTGKVSVLAVFPNALASTANIQSLFGCPAGPPNICNLPPQIPAQHVPRPSPSARTAGTTSAS